MNDVEDRVRRALRTDVPGVGAEQLLSDVHRGAVARRRRRATGLIVASVLAVAGVAGVVVQLRGDDDARPEPPPASELPTTPLPPGSARGSIAVSVASPEAVFRLTANDGCVACDTVWRHDASADGGWTRLHDFQARDAAALPLGPVTHLRMAANGRDGWAWGAVLYSTHDGGRTWTVVTEGPGEETVYGRVLSLSQDFAWSLMRTDRGTVLWRSSLGADDWSRVDVPDISGATGMFTVRDRVALEVADEGLANPRVQTSHDGGVWERLAKPCGGENKIHPAESAAFIICDEGERATVYRTTDLARWEVFGEPKGIVAAVAPVADDRLLIVHDTAPATLLTPTGRTAVDLGLAPDERVLFEGSSSGGLSLLTTLDERLVGSALASTDGGLTWQRMD